MQVSVQGLAERLETHRLKQLVVRAQSPGARWAAGGSETLATGQVNEDWRRMDLLPGNAPEPRLKHVFKCVGVRYPALIGVGVCHASAADGARERNVILVDRGSIL